MTLERKVILGLALAVVACIGLIVLSAIGISTASTNTARIRNLIAENTQLASRLAADEHRTCAIQKRGLPAGHALAASMRGIHALLTQKPHTQAERARAAQTPRYIKRIVRRLNRHLAKYLRLEAKQPQTRDCNVGST